MPAQRRLTPDARRAQPFRMRRGSRSFLSVVGSFLTAAVLCAACGAPKKATPCTNACETSGAKQCSGASLQVCGALADGCLGWTTTSTCPTGEVCRGEVCAPDCAIPCGATACCTTGQACVAGACCDSPCGSECCVSPQICAQDGSGKKTCGTPCALSGECQQQTPPLACCALQPGGGGACMAAQTALVCLCNVNAECSTNSCSPDTPKEAAGPYVCSPYNGAAYAGCSGGQACVTAGFDCWQDPSGNDFCTRSCSVDSDCAMTGACCSHTATCSNVGKGCAAAGACMPCQ